MTSIQSNLIEFNCLGTIFLIRETSLNRFPNTLLGDLKRRTTFYNENRHQYIIDRHIISFEAILNYYETGKLIAPTVYEPIIFLEELKYFQFDKEIIEHFSKTEIHEEFLTHHRIVPFNRFFQLIWISLEYKDYSILSQFIQFLCLIISLLYCMNISIELLPQISRDKVICYKVSSSKTCENIFFDFRPSKITSQWIYQIEQIIIQVIEKNWDQAYVTRLEDLFNIVTISTITVGDAKRVPLSPTGKILCSFLAGIGLISISLPLTSIYRIFQSIYRLENMDKRFIIIKYVYPNGELVQNHIIHQ
ncbi:hypothetical protein I4U23_021466 [Adineta vaga]|nr:hypothetical protein I4U23_021466 [Adineta vaga]